jgi:hypothetical protein
MEPQGTYVEIKVYGVDGQEWGVTYEPRSAMDPGFFLYYCVDKSRGRLDVQSKLDNVHGRVLTAEEEARIRLHCFPRASSRGSGRVHALQHDLRHFVFGTSDGVDRDRTPHKNIFTVNVYRKPDAFFFGKIRRGDASSDLLKVGLITRASCHISIAECDIDLYIF